MHKNDHSIHFSRIIYMSMNSYLITIMQAMSEILTHCSNTKTTIQIYFYNQLKKKSHSIHFSRIIICQ